MGCSRHKRVKDAYAEFLEERLKERDKYKDLDIDGREVLKLFLKEWNWRMWTGFI
jgi:hypothetical protein